MHDHHPVRDVTADEHRTVADRDVAGDRARDAGLPVERDDGAVDVLTVFDDDVAGDADPAVLV